MVYIPYLGWIAGVVFLVVEKDKKVRWHAAQSVAMFAVFAAVQFVALPLMYWTRLLMPVAGFINNLVGLGFLVGWLYLAVKTHQGEIVKVPYLSEVADKLSH